MWACLHDIVQWRELEDLTLFSGGNNSHHSCGGFFDFFLFQVYRVSF